MSKFVTFGLGGTLPQLTMLGFARQIVRVQTADLIRLRSDEQAFRQGLVQEFLDLDYTTSNTWRDRSDFYVIAEISRGVLTGGPDSLPDLPLNLTSYSGSTRVTGEDYLSLIVANTPGLQTEIDARPNGDLLLYAGTRDNTGAEVLTILIDVNLEDVRPDQGPSSSKIALSGYKSVTYGSPQARTVEKVNYTSVSSGRQRVRHPGIEYDVRPGDTITAGTLTFVVDQISYSSSLAQAATEFSEAET